ncbi:Phage shock protein A [Pontiella desulfatans]|uniref:Phage shock protein A n=1 Tax=Pontiella desulfatans TaxID=2750659 RepID=A0A6C2TVL2_PONDE|nr:PspA/IM30 family protein [Pontiella desulfatans]VGO11623.1 Phage shock protein A [Pontiella desulfatans]
MGLLSRLKDISTGKVKAFLDEAERPEEMIPQLLNELQSQQQALRNAEAKSLTAVRAAQRRLEETMGRALRLERGAELALKKGEEETAREALREQLKVEQVVPRQREQVEQAQKILDDVRERGNALKAQIALVKEKEVQLKTRPEPALSPDRTEPLLKKVAEMEERVLTEEAEAEANREVNQNLRKRSLDERLFELEKNDEIEKRLNQIKTGN